MQVRSCLHEACVSGRVIPSFTKTELCAKTIQLDRDEFEAHGRLHVTAVAIEQVQKSDLRSCSIHFPLAYAPPRLDLALDIFLAVDRRISWRDDGPELRAMLHRSVRVCGERSLRAHMRMFLAW